MRRHPWLFILWFLCPAFAHPQEPKRRPSMVLVRRMTRPISRYLRKRGLVKRGRCVSGSTPQFGNGLVFSATVSDSDAPSPSSNPPAGVSSSIEFHSLSSSSPNPLPSSSSPSPPPPSSSPSQSAKGTSQFTLKEEAMGSSFFDRFAFFTDPDPTSGFVTYVDEATARSEKLIGTQGRQIFIKADNTTQLASAGTRKSVRITSQSTVSSGSLVIFDATHVPYGCATWPAFWMLGAGAEWPHAGEIDIFEGVNLHSMNQMTLHSDKGCNVARPMQGLGKVLSTDCDAYSKDNAACSVQDPNTKSYGEGFNANGGGAWAVLWTDKAISMWFWPRGGIPSDVDAKQPQPSKWGKPVANWDNSACDFKKYFAPQQYIFDLTFCGQWAGRDNVWSTSGCKGTCADWMTDPTNFDDAYWLVNYVRVYAS